MFKIDFSTNRYSFRATLRDKITVIEGDSGTGKSFLTNFLSVYSTTTDNVYVATTVWGLKGYIECCKDNSLIVIDKVEQLNEFKKMCNVIENALFMQKRQIYFIIMLRGDIPLPLHISMYAELETKRVDEHVMFSLKYKY